MSLLDRVRNAGSNALNNIERIGEKAVDNVKTAVKEVREEVQEAGQNFARGVNAAENHIVRNLQAQGNQIRFGLDRALDNVRDAGSTLARVTARGLNQVTHPGSPNPPAAQGLSFAETKNASGLSYTANRGERYQFADGGKWEVTDVQDDSRSGFRAIALRSLTPGDNRTIVAFAGTTFSSGADWRNNIQQGLGLNSRQYQQATDFASRHQAAGGNVILTGHSLGGGLASYASIRTGLRATALNAAPLALNHLGGNPLRSAVRNNPRITQYYVPGEVLTGLDRNNRLDVRPGNHIAVQGRHSNLNPLSPILNHSWASAAPNINNATRLP